MLPQYLYQSNQPMQRKQVEREHPTSKHSHSSPNSLLKNIQKCLHSDDPSAITAYLIQFEQLKPNQQSTSKLHEMVQAIAIERCKYRKVINHFICLLKEMHVLAKGQESLFEERLFYEHLNGLQNLLKREEIGVWGSDIKEVLSRHATTHNTTNTHKYSSDLQMNLTKQNEISRQGANFNLDSAMNDTSFGLHSSDRGMMDYTQIKHVKQTKEAQQLRKQMEEVNSKVKMFAMKFDLRGGTTIEKLIALEEHIRSMSFSHDKEMKQKVDSISKYHQEKQKELRDEVSRLKDMVQQLQKEISHRPANQRLALQLKDKQKEAENKIELNKQKQISFKKKSASEQPRLTASLFFGESSIVSSQNTQSISFIKQKVLQLTKITAVKTSMLFTSKSTQEYTNFHKFFDGRPNILILIKISNDRIVGGFSLEPFQPNCLSSDGFLFSLTHKEAFEKIKGSAIQYNPESIVFGKNELRIKNKSLSLYSNFGSIQRNFHSHSQKVDYFLGNGQSRYVQMAVFELWQIHTE